MHRVVADTIKPNGTSVTIDKAGAVIVLTSPPSYGSVSEDTLITKGMLLSAASGIIPAETAITVNAGTALTSDSGTYYYQVDMSVYPQYGLNPTRWAEVEVTSLIREKITVTERKVLDGGGNLLYLRFYFAVDGSGNTLDKNFIIIKK